MQLRDVGLIAQFEISRHLRSIHGIASLSLLLLFCSVSGYKMAETADQFDAIGRSTGPMMKAISGLVEGTTDLPAVAIARLLGEHSPILVGLFALLIMLMPLYAILIAYDQTASDIESKHVRYLLFRSDRASIYLGKSLGAWAMLTGSLGIAIAVMGLFLGLRSGAVDGMDGVRYLVRIWLTAGFYALPLVSLLGLGGALVGRARRVASFTIGYWISVSILSGIGTVTDTPLRSANYLFPTADRFNLLLDSPAEFGPTAAYLLIFTAACVGLGLWRFVRRDL